ncbi:MAG: flavodoxin-dependent (E)-4-hydroxy-3-methylbut-2-enyl-diphosphate synthase [Oscillospiraceae bacterium]|jgi:(E)-4-hydroxy-3-methylbut-2-enyl-diphosphate synthase|nr:flavodoxin-dependent (E)-4-hydroxy-3-methylbut-2-enyl-diphosphate synthase [Oscillospiraceae bacterium]
MDSGPDVSRGARRGITVGGVRIGAGADVTVQSMTNTKTADVEATSAQIDRLRDAGCDIVRVAVPDVESARAIARLKKRCGIPIVADVHFDYRLAIEAARSGADKIRINPGNIGGAERVRAVAECCRQRGIPIRIGVNGGSLEREMLRRYGGATARALAESALRQAEELRACGFEDICLSVKSSDVRVTVDAYRLLHSLCDYPLHLGVTEAGTEHCGVIKSSVGIGALLCEGIGDTIRVSLTAPPEREVKAGIAILKAAGLRAGGVEIISCPTCGRTNVDLMSLVRDVETRLRGMTGDMTVAVMGCAVNGPGEARAADYGIACGEGAGVVFKKGEVVARAPAERLADELVTVIASSSPQ